METNSNEVQRSYKAMSTEALSYKHSEYVKELRELDDLGHFANESTESRKRTLQQEIKRCKKELDTRQLRLF